jgi:hypothetical protein
VLSLSSENKTFGKISNKSLVVMKSSLIVALLIGLVVFVASVVPVFGNGDFEPECYVDYDCEYLNADYCDGGYLMHDEGVCIAGYCYAFPAPIQDCFYYTEYCDGTTIMSDTGFCNDQIPNCDYTINEIQDCRDELTCNGQETCDAGQCVDAPDIVCENPPKPAECYDQGYCDEGLQSCVYQKLPDNTGPVTSDLVVQKLSETCMINIEAVETDTCSNIETAEYFLGGITCKAEGTGTLMNAKDGSFDELIEDVIKNNVIVSDGSLNVHVRGKDSAGNWGPCKTVRIDIDCIPPYYPTNVALDGVVNAHELLVCGNNPLLTANVCDDQSRIQLAEYFIDEDNPLNWYGIPMNPSDGGYDELCEDIEAIVDASVLEDGTHYVQLHAKDGQENWGKFEFSPIVSFIRDTTAPSTIKTVDTPKVRCDITYDGENNIEECWYIQQGTEIHLTATDPDPQGTGEFAGLDKIMCQFRWKFNWDDSWSAWTEPAECPNPIVFNEDSYHEIKYWSVDTCGNVENPHYELDIVDTQSPFIWKEVGQPSVLVDPTCDPKTSVCDYYVTTGTDITLHCADQDPHPVNDVTIYYYWLNLEDQTSDRGSVNAESYTFRYPTDSEHKLYFWCEDALGNTAGNSEVVYETDYVDTQAPQTTKDITGPQIDGQEIIHKYITKDSTIILNCADQDPHPVNDVTLYWELYWNEECVDSCSPDWGKPIDSGSSDGHKEFTGLEDSCHKLVYWCVDALGNTEQTNIEIDAVDNKAPVVNKEVGTPKVESTQMTEYLVPDNYDIKDTAWFITKDTLITLTCEDQLPHPVNDVKIYYKYYNDGSPIQEWTLYAKPFTYGEDTYHELYYYCEDSLGNKGPVHYELDIVDTQSPSIWKEVGQPSVLVDPTCDPKTSVCDYYVTTGTDITLHCADQDPHPVNDVTIYYYWLNLEDQTSDRGSVNAESYTFRYPTDSEHKLYFWCEDALGNTAGNSEVVYETDYVDTQAPQTTKDITGPQYYDDVNDKFYIDGRTEIELTCVDLPPHPVDDVKIYYRYRVDDDTWPEKFTEYTGKFKFPEESKHELEYYCVDALGNEECHKFEIDYVDHTPPVTTKAYGRPFYTDGVSDWITTKTPITLTADDGDSIHSSGVKETYWRNTLVDERYCSGEWNCQDVEGSGSWNVYEKPFYKNEESCHLIEYYSVDNVEKTETVKKQCVFVEDTPPTIYKKISGPEHVCTEEEWYNYGEPNYGCHYITQQSTIYLNCVDEGNHPVNDVTLYWRDYLIGNEPPAYTEVLGGYAEIQKKEDSEHILEFYCVDALGNSQGTVDNPHVEIDIVDTQAPHTEKTVGEPKYPGQDDVDWWITQNTIINLDCSDGKPHPVDHVTLYWRDYLEDDEPGEWNVEEDGYAEIQKDEDCRHVLEWYCADVLGNSEGTEEKPIVEIDQVDTESPEITKFVIKDGERIYTPEEGTITVAIQPGESLIFCANVTDVKQTGDLGVGVDKVWGKLSTLDDPMGLELVWDENEQAYCAELVVSENCGKWHYEVKAKDLLGNEGEWIDGIEIIIDNVPPIGEVLNPHAGNNYYAGKIFPFYAPSVDFGGDYCDCPLCFLYDGCEQFNCPATGVDYCDVYAIDYNFEALDQDQIKECWEDIFEYFMQIGIDPYTEYIGRVPYEDGVCKGYLTIPEDTELTDTVFMVVKWVDKAGNERFGLALNPWLSPITMNMEEKGLVSITEIFDSPVTSNDLLTVKATLSESGLNGNKECRGIIEKHESEGTTYIISYDGDVTGNAVDGYQCIITGSLPDQSAISSGDYKFIVEYRLNDDWQIELIGSDSFDFIVDNSPPEKTIISPEEGGTYGINLPISVSLKDVAGIDTGTVKYRIFEPQAWWDNFMCIIGICPYSSGWLDLTLTSGNEYDGTYEDAFDTSALSSGKTYILQIVGCDVLHDDLELDQVKAGMDTLHCSDPKISFVIDLDAPVGPSNVKIKDLTVTWDAATDALSGVSYYKVYRIFNDTYKEVVHVVNAGDVLSFTVNEAGTYGVSAVDKVNNEGQIIIATEPEEVVTHNNGGNGGNSRNGGGGGTTTINKITTIPTTTILQTATSDEVNTDVGAELTTTTVVSSNTLQASGITGEFLSAIYSIGYWWILIIIPIVLLVAWVIKK